MILLVGGSGTLGSAIARQLVAADLPVTVMSRDPDRHSSRFPAAVNFVRGDLRDKAALERAVSGKSLVVAAAHSILGRGRSASRYVDDLGHKSLIDVSIAARVDRFIYVSAWFEQRTKLNTFFAAKRRIELSLRSSGLVHTILRPTAFMEMHAEQMIGLRVKANKPVVVFGPGTAARNFVAAEDVAKVVVAELRCSDPQSRSINVGGPQNLSTRDIIAVYETLLNRTAKVVTVPLAVASLLHHVFKPLHPGLSQIMDMTRQIERDGDGFVVKDHPESAGNSSLRNWAGDRIAERCRPSDRNTPN